MTLKIESDTLYSINPQTGERVGDFRGHLPDEIPAILEKARKAQELWGGFSLKTRLELMGKAYRQFYLFRDEIAELISNETGKPLVEAYSCEIMPVLDCFKYYLKNLPQFLQEAKITAMNPLLKLRKGFVRYEPLGVVAVISPWNFPFLLAMQHIVPAIFAGNAVIHKPSEQTTLTGLKIREIFDRAYLPKGILEIVTGLADVGQALVSAKVDKIFFTGSTQVGKRVYQAAAQNLVPVNMELGGSDAMIVLEDANLERAVNAAIWGAFSNAGQACLSVERLYVHDAIFNQFVDRLIEKTRQVRYCQNHGADGEVSCLANAAQFTKINQLLEDAIRKGAVVKLGGKPRVDLGDWYFEPTILTRVNETMEIARQELFGPVIAVTPFLTDDEAVFLANASEFGLAASIWTQNQKRGRRLAQRIQAGSISINELFVHVGQTEAPYSGFKNSGIGVSHGPWGVMEMVRPKYINTDRPMIRFALSLVARRLVNHDIWWFKYNERLLKGMKAFSDFLHGDTFWRRVKAVPAALKALFRSEYL